MPLIVTASISRIFFLLTSILVVGAVVAGCVRPPYDRQDAFAVTSELFSASDVKHTLQSNGTGKMEILHATTGNRQISVMFVETYQSGVISDQAVFPKFTMRGWKDLRGKNLEFSVKDRAVTPGGEVKYARFSYQGNSCFSFHSLFDPSSFDTLSRYTKLIAGYYCQALPAPLADAAITKLLSSITVPKFNNVMPTAVLSPNIYYEPILPLTVPSTPAGKY